ncbi:MAG TPA: hypothetical protein VF530_02430 [Planctomycetota bacterium]
MRTLDRVPAWLWLWAGPAIVVAQVATKVIGESTYRGWMRGERGIVENLTVAFLLSALVCALLAWRERRRVRWRLFGPAALVFAAGLLFFAGEEASWGQHWLGFEPPESIAQRNDQGEFNLHNDPVFEKVLDQLPRTLLTLAALVGGVLAPLVRRRRGLAGRDFASASPWDWAWPSLACLPAAALALTVTLPEKVCKALDRPVPYLIEISAGETKEYCLALFLLVYALGLLRALRAEGQSMSPT